MKVQGLTVLGLGLKELWVCSGLQDQGFSPTAAADRDNFRGSLSNVGGQTEAAGPKGIRGQSTTP